MSAPKKTTHAATMFAAVVSGWQGKTAKPHRQPSNRASQAREQPQRKSMSEKAAECKSLTRLEKSVYKKKSKFSERTSMNIAIHDYKNFVFQTSAFFLIVQDQLSVSVKHCLLTY